MEKRIGYATGSTAPVRLERKKRQGCGNSVRRRRICSTRRIFLNNPSICDRFLHRLELYDGPQTIERGRLPWSGNVIMMIETKLVTCSSFAVEQGTKHIVASF